jgi:HEAT repeat protein
MALAEIGPDAKDAVPALIAALKSKEVEVRGASAHALGEIGSGAKSAIDALTQVIKNDDDADVRKTAVLAIGKIQGQDR